MKLRRITSLVAALAIAAGIVGAAATPAAANDVDRCDTYHLWVNADVGSNKMMASCQYGTDINGRYWVATQIWSTSFWTGFHGCVYIEFLRSDGTLVLRSPTRRWGVSADHHRLEYWYGPLPTAAFDRYAFTQWRC